MANYGVPYKGSKNKIAKELVNQLPAAKNFYDLFAGGCAVTHAAMESGKYERFIANDLNPMPVQLFVDSIHGRYTTKTEKRWISREDYERLKLSDPYVRYVWSFGNNGKDYLHGKEVEPLKRLLHLMCCAESPTEARLYWLKFCHEFKQHDIPIGRKLQELEELERLERLEELERLERRERLESHSVDYQRIMIEPDSIIYCDIPYKDTDGYDKKFDYERFYEWACKQTQPIFISEYQMPDERFKCVWERQKTCTMSEKNNKKTVERLYIPR